MIIKSSQWINIGFIIFGVTFFTFIIPPLIALYKILEVYTCTYTIDKHRIVEKKGIFSVTHKEINFYRIKNIRFEEPFLMRLVGLGNLYIICSDPSFQQKELKITGIVKGEEIWKQLRIKTLNNRQHFGVREYDFFNL